MMHRKTHIPLGTLAAMADLRLSKYYDWKSRKGRATRHNGITDKRHWILPEEREAIIDYAKEHLHEAGYRRMTYMMLDENVVAVSPSTTYRILKQAGLLDRWNISMTKTKKHGFDQPARVHEHWHIDIKYVNFHGTFLFLISIIDGFSRYIVHHELRTHMQEYDVQCTLQIAWEKFPHARPRIISDNGPQFIAKEFYELLRVKGLQQIRTSVRHPQSNGKIERFHRTISEECLRQQSFINLDDASYQINAFIDYYNNRRLHSAIHYLTPADCLNGLTAQRLNERYQKLSLAKQKRSDFNHAA